MNNRDIISLKKDILLNLSKRQLKDAFDLLIKLSVHLQDWKISGTLSELETNYKYMLHYMFEGVADPERETVYRNLLRSLYELTDDATEELLNIESSNIFYEKYRANAPKNNSLAEYQFQLKDTLDSLSLADLIEDIEEKKNRKRELSVKRERIGSDIFNSIFVSPRANDTDMNDYLSFIDNPDLSVRQVCSFQPYL